MSDLNSVIRKIKPCDCNEPYVFVSYSSVDRELVWRDVLEFQKRGYNVWLDEKNLDKTKDSWKEDALTAIEDMDCMLLVFYVSAASLRSDACYQELSKTVAEGTKALHFGPVKFIAIDAEAVGDIKLFHQHVFEEIRSSNLDKEERRKQALALNGFMQQFFNSNNEKVRIHPKNEENRKMDYYEEILASFPDETRIYPDEGSLTEEEAEEQVPAVEAEPKQEKTEAEEPKQKTEQSVSEVREPKQKTEQSAGEEKEPEKKAEQSVSEAREPEKKPEQSVSEEKEPEKKAEQSVSEAKETAGAESENLAEEALPAEETEAAVEEEISAESAEEDASLPDHFTHYEERPKNKKCGRNIFKKKNIEEARQGGGIYRLVTGYTATETKVFGSVFGGRKDIVQMDLPDSMEEFNSGEFKDCINMKKIRIPKYLEKISFEAFKGCSSLKCVEVPGNVTVIDSMAFQGCSSLEQVKLPEGLKRIGMCAFENCYSLEELFLPPLLEEIETRCFFHCTSLKEMTIPGSVKKISSNAFDGCTALQKVIVEEGVEEIGAAFGSCGKKLEIWIPSSVNKISGIAFFETIAVIHCDAGSYAQQYAEKERIACTLN